MPLQQAQPRDSKSSNLVGALTYSQIDSQSPILPPDFSVYTISQKDTLRPIYYEYNVGIDESLPWKSHMWAAYVGNKSVNLASYNGGANYSGANYNSASDLNIICGIETGCPTNNNPNMAGTNDNLFNIDPSYSALCTYDGGALCGIYGNPVIDGIGGLGTPEYDFYRPYPFYQHIYQLNHNFYSNYNSAQIEWDKASGIVTFGANYTFAKNLATASSYNNQLVDPVHLRNDYNPVPYDRTQVFNIHYLVDLGKRYKGGTWWISELSNGWKVSGISQVMSGFPLTVRKRPELRLWIRRVCECREGCEPNPGKSTRAATMRDALRDRTVIALPI